MKFNVNFLKEYLNEAPIPLANERAFECLILSQQDFKRPILDIGCGDGIFAKILFKENIETGLDPLEHELESASNYNIYDELIHAYGDQIPKPDDTYQTIFSNSVLEHIKDLNPVLQEIRRVMKPGGRLYVTLPTNLFEKYTVISMLLNVLGLKKLADKYNNGFNKFWNHFHYYDREGWERIFEKNGFKTDKIIEYGTSTDCIINDALVPFSFPSFVVKKLANKFFISKRFRKLYSPMINSVLEKRIKIHPGLSNGGLIFLSLRKI